MTELPSYITRELAAEYGPIKARFTLTQTPEGGAPEYIRKDWVGLALPVRKQALARLALGTTRYTDLLSLQQKDNNAPVSIVGLEAVHALNQAGYEEAEDYWLPYQDGLFTFRAYEGELELLARQAQAASITSDRHPERNEDSYHLDADSDIYGVFDGVGGYAGGEVASRLAAETLALETDNITAASGFDAVTASLRQMLASANEKIKDETAMAATTAAIARIHTVDGVTYVSVAHVGDSRAYLVHEGKLRAITTDHTPQRVPGHTQEAMARQERLAEAVDLSGMSQATVNAFVHRNIIGASLGQDDTVLADIKHFAVEPGDILILTSDGVHDNLTTTEMQQLLDSGDSDYADLLVNASYHRACEEHHRRAKMDDITALVVSI